LPSLGLRFGPIRSSRKPSLFFSTSRYWDFLAGAHSLPENRFSFSKLPSFRSRSSSSRPRWYAAWDCYSSSIATLPTLSGRDLKRRSVVVAKIVGSHQIDLRVFLINDYFPVFHSRSCFPYSLFFPPPWLSFSQMVYKESPPITSRSSSVPPSLETPSGSEASVSLSPDQTTLIRQATLAKATSQEFVLPFPWESHVRPVFQ